ncbi:MAG: hypothetical protein RLZZ301_1169 [Bacteroidota bacterium]
MSAVVKELLANWEAELLQFRSDDLLADLQVQKLISREEDLIATSAISQQIWKEARRIFKENGSIALVKSSGVFCWKRNGKHLKSPLFLHSANQISFEKQQVEFEPEGKLNPYFLLLFSRETQLQIPDEPDFNWFVKLCESHPEFEVLPATYFGNFHPQRYELWKEWEALTSAETYSSVLQQIVGDFDHVEPHESAPQVLFSERDCSPFLDPDQQTAIRSIARQNTLVYGPPGTGKSTLIVETLVAMCRAQLRSIVLTDKRVALEVIAQRLAKIGLHDFALILTDRSEEALFYKKLQHHWQKLALTPRSYEHHAQESHTDSALKYYEQRQALEASTGYSLEVLVSRFNYSKKHVGQVHLWRDFLAHEARWNSLPEALMPLVALAVPSWQTLSRGALQTAANDWEKAWQALRDQLAECSFQDLENQLKKGLICVQFQAQVYQRFGRFLGPEKKKLASLVERYKKAQKQLNRLENALQHWIQRPSEAEYALLLKQASATGFFQKRAFKKSWKKWVRTPELEPLNCLKDYEKALAANDKLLQLEAQLEQFGITDFGQELALIESLWKQTNAENWQWYQQLSETERKHWASNHRERHAFMQATRSFLNLAPTDKLAEVAVRLEKQLDLLIQTKESWQELPQTLWPLMRISDSTLRQEVIAADFWQDLRLNYPLLVQLDAPQFQDELVKSIDRAKQTDRANQQACREGLYARFWEAQHLLEAPLRQLNAPQKEKRLRLRKGKAILVKEMAKTRQHLSIGALFASEAKEWLELLYPFLLVSPIALANVFPMHPELHDLLIIDEASQLPLSQCIGALQRAKRVFIAGDPQQMRPSSFFQLQGTEGVIDVLHQAAFYLPSVLLRQHYRSEHPDLIAFSNQKFYQQHLQALPAKDPSKQALFHHYIPTGVYQDRQNIEEAKALVAKLTPLLKSTQKIGVVAFSESQLSCILSQLNPAQLQLLEQKQSEGSLFIKALEHVQGEECDVLLISFGYGKNENAVFEKRFGPMNQAQGAGRLNVLLTRARQELHFFSSVKASDFGTKTSSGSQLIKEWFDFLESPVRERPQVDAYSCLKTAKDFYHYRQLWHLLYANNTPLVNVSGPDHSQIHRADGN